MRKQLIIPLQDQAAALDQGEQIYAVLLDFSKAFDKVSYQLLTIKLQHYGVRGNLLMWIRSFLASRSQRVLVEGHTSGLAPVTSGVPQGLIPLLFLLYINDMSQKVDSISRLFADDAPCTGRYRRYMTPRSCKMTSTNCSSGRKTGRCHSTQVNVRLSESLRNGTLLQLPMPSMVATLLL